jgi:hypothetical protein
MRTGARGVKQQLAAMRMLFDWLITGRSHRRTRRRWCAGPSASLRPAKTPVLEGNEKRKLLGSTPTITCAIYATAP